MPYVVLRVHNQVQNLLILGDEQESDKELMSFLGGKFVKGMMSKAPGFETHLSLPSVLNRLESRGFRIIQTKGGDPWLTIMLHKEPAGDYEKKPPAYE